MDSLEKTDIGDKIWTVCFALMYPIISLFGLIFTGSLAILSLISRFFVFLFR